MSAADRLKPAAPNRSEILYRFTAVGALRTSARGFWIWIPLIRGREKSKFGIMLNVTASAVDEKLGPREATTVLSERPLGALDDAEAVEGINSGIKPTLNSESEGVCEFSINFKMLLFADDAGVIH